MIVALVSVALLIAAAVAMTWLSSSGPRAVEACYRDDADFLESFSLKAYRPITRLAGGFDKDFLGTAHSPALAKCYRGIQRKILREYLRVIAKDFNRLYAIANARAARAANDRGDLSMALFEQQMSFIFLMWGIEARLFLGPLFPGPINLKPLIEYVENLAAQTRELGRPQLSYHAV